MCRNAKFTQRDSVLLFRNKIKVFFECKRIFESTICTKSWGIIYVRIPTLVINIEYALLNDREWNRVSILINPCIRIKHEFEESL